MSELLIRVEFRYFPLGWISLTISERWEGGWNYRVPGRIACFYFTLEMQNIDYNRFNVEKSFKLSSLRKLYIKFVGP